MRLKPRIKKYIKDEMNKTKMIRRDKNPAKTDRIANFMKKIENSPIKRKNIEVLNLTRAVTLENTNKK